MFVNLHKRMSGSTQRQRDRALPATAAICARLQLSASALGLSG